MTFVFIGVSGFASQALASSKATLSDMDLSITEAAQEFVESILDDYSDVLDDSFSAAVKPLKSVTKDLTKQLSKAAASPTADGALTVNLDGAKTALDTASASFDTLVADTDT
ncbi:MAG: hypothetical protein WBG38_09185, partial [Nodosilinea sp.]